MDEWVDKKMRVGRFISLSNTCINTLVNFHTSDL